MAIAAPTTQVGNRIMIISKGITGRVKAWEPGPVIRGTQHWRVRLAGVHEEYTVSDEDWINVR